MPSFSSSRHVAAPPDVLFRVATDLDRWPERIRGIERIERLTTGPVGVGTRFRETRTLFGRQATEEMEFTDFDPPRRYALGAESHGTRYLTEVRIEPEGEGSWMELRFEGTPLGLVTKVLSILTAPLAGAVRKEIEKDMDDLKRAAEEAARAEGGAGEAGAGAG